MKKMIAKFVLTKISKPYDGAEALEFHAVSEKPFNQEGASDDNSFARFTPDGKLVMTVQNPALLGQFKEGQKFYLEFTPIIAG